MSAVVTAARLGRLGDLVMTLPALAWLADRVDLQVLTDAVHVPWLSLALPEAKIASRADALRPAHGVLDLHGIAASRRALRGVPRAAGAVAVRTDKEGLRRRLLLTPLPGPRPRWTWPERHLRAAQTLARALGLAGSPPRGALPRLTSEVLPTAGLLGIVPGATWATKRWPAEHFGELAALWRTQTGGSARVFASREEDALATAVIGASRGAATRFPEGGPGGDDALVALVGGIASCAAVVAGDTGPLHVAGALRRPLVGLFGPTPRDSGFAIWTERATFLGGADCSPCSMHGGRRCPRCHHRCLVEVAPSRVLAALLDVADLRDAA